MDPATTCNAGNDPAHWLPPWLRLERTPGVGAGTARRLLATFGLPENIFTANLADLLAVVPEKTARALLLPPPDTTLALIDKTLEWASRSGNRVLTLADPDYPQLLLDIPDPPAILYAKGRIDLLAVTALAVVGSRNATAQGISNAEKFSEAISHGGITIVSGMALGIDAAAHEGGLRAAGSTVAVIGTGPDIVYPARNHALAHRIADAGCLLSEYPLGTPAIAANFPRRNRLISGLARAVLVVEAAAQSGSLITARMAGEQGRDVFAIPGSIHSPLAKGCHQLIKQGAKLVECAQDVLEELQPSPLSQPRPASHASPGIQSMPSPLLEAMGYDPVDPDTLALRCSMQIADVHAQLLTLEMNGTVEMLAGGLFRRLATS